MISNLTNESAAILSQAPALLSNIWFFLHVIIGFSLIVFVHELGHFLAAKWAGVRVERFAIGFGKELFGFTRGETRYSFNLLPLGGYVKMLGQEDFVVDKTGELKVKEDPNSFTNKSVGKRMVIVTAGVIMNLIFAAIAFTIVAMVGLKQMPPVIGYVDKNKPAGRAGLQAGDRILEINGVEVDSFTHLSALISLSGDGEELVLKVLRDGKIVEPHPKVLPEYVKDVELRQIGVGPGWNRRVAAPGIRLTNLRPNELHENDELFKLIVDGKEQVYKDTGSFAKAIVSKNGEPVDAIVKRPKHPETLTSEQLLASDPDIESTEVKVQIQPLWVPLPYENKNQFMASLLGLVPRLTAIGVTPDKSFDTAGLQPGDVLARIGTHDNPTYAQLKATIEKNHGDDIELKVKRIRAANHGLSGETVEYCVNNREALIAAARQNFSQVETVLTKLAHAQGVPPAELDKLLEHLKKTDSHSSWRSWLENIDVHTLKSFRPDKPFALFSDPPATIDAAFLCADEDHLLVADVIKQYEDRDTPASQANIPPGAVILKVDGQPVRKWYQLFNVFRAKAGSTVDIAYRLVDEELTCKMQIPNCIQAELGLRLDDRITKIDGKSSFMVKSGENEHKVALPDWRATQAGLEASIGKTIQVDYVTRDGETRSGQYTVTEVNTDPWLNRADFLTFRCYPLRERHPIRNPFLALGAGIQQAHRATMQTIMTIRHMLFSGNVGLKKVSGPVGILHIGKEVAKNGPLDLLWLMGLLSANLAVINFLPLPIVDGGLFLFLLLEKIRGEPVSIKTQVATQLIGIALIATVFLLVTYQDIIKIFS